MGVSSLWGVVVNNRAFTFLEVLVSLFLLSVLVLLLMSFLKILEVSKNGALELSLAMDVLKRDILYASSVASLNFIVDGKKIEWCCNKGKVIRIEEEVKS